MQRRLWLCRLLLLRVVLLLLFELLPLLRLVAPMLLLLRFALLLLVELLPLLRLVAPMLLLLRVALLLLFPLLSWEQGLHRRCQTHMLPVEWWATEWTAG